MVSLLSNTFVQYLSDTASILTLENNGVLGVEICNGNIFTGNVTVINKLTTYLFVAVA